MIIQKINVVRHESSESGRSICVFWNNFEVRSRTLRVTSENWAVLSVRPFSLMGFEVGYGASQLGFGNRIHTGNGIRNFLHPNIKKILPKVAKGLIA